jgi:hypothetical protein
LNQGRYLVDTNIFNELLDGGIEWSSLPEGIYVYSSWQRIELERTSNISRRQRLLEVFAALITLKDAQPVTTHTTPWGSPWGVDWDRKGRFYADIFAALEEIKPRDRGNQGDAVNLELCLYEGLCFVTWDHAAARVAQSFEIPFQIPNSRASS